MIRVALIGLGKMGISHLAIIRSHPGVEMVAVCDSTKYVLDVLGKYTGIETYTDYRQLLDCEQLDAVIVATPSRLHGEIVRAGLERGIHVFCEKPFCLDIAEAEALAALAEAKGLVNQVGYHYRFVGTMKETRRLVEAGAIGKIHHIRAEAYGAAVLRPKGNTWRASKADGGGCLRDFASHAIDLMNYLVGPPCRVSGSVLDRVFSDDVDDAVYSTFHYPDGMTGQLASNWSDDSFRKMSMKVSLWGSRGHITADRQEVQVYSRGEDGTALGLKPGWNVRYTTELTEDVWYYLRGEEFSAQIDFFIKQITSGRRDAAFSFASGLQTDRVIQQITHDASGVHAPNNDQRGGLQLAPEQRRGVLHRLFGARS